MLPYGLRSIPLIGDVVVTLNCLNDHALLSGMSSSIFTFLPLLLRSFRTFHRLPDARVSIHYSCH